MSKYDGRRRYSQVDSYMVDGRRAAKSSGPAVPLEGPGSPGYTRAMNFPEFQAKIAKGKVPPVCAFVGAEEFLRAEGERRVREAVFGGDEPDLGVVAFDCPKKQNDIGRFDAAAVFDEASSFPLLVAKKIVILRDADLFITAHRDALERLASDPPSFCVIVMACEKMARNTRLAKAVEKAGGYVECKKLYETEFGADDVTPRAPLARWLMARASEREVRIEPEAACELIRRVGSSLRELDGGLERIGLLIEAGKVATRALVEAEFPYTRDYAAFKTLDLLDSGNMKGALEVVRTLFRQGMPESGGRTVREPRGIAAILVSQLSRFLEARFEGALALGRGLNPDEAAREAGIRGPRAKSVMGRLKRTPPARLRYRLAQTLQAERDLKGESRMAAELVVEGLLVRLSTPPGARAIR